MLRIPSSIRCGSAFAACLLLVNCTTSPGTPTGVTGRCGGATVNLAALSAITAACDSSTTLTLAANGASYLVVPQFATDTGLVSQPVSYSISATGGVVAAPAPVANQVHFASLAERGATPKRLDQAQRTFDAALMARARRTPASQRRSLARGPLLLTTVPTVGSTRQFQVLSSTTLNRYATVTGQLMYVGNNILLYQDTQSPSNGFSSSQLQGVGQLFDQTMYPIDTTTFGSPTDIDQNGRLIMLMSPVVNSLTPASTCQQQGFIGGFFNSTDLVNAANSNGGEIFYSIVPDPNGTVSCAHSVNEMLLDTPAIFLHELQHLINFSQHFVLRNGNAEKGWLDEGLSIVAEELGSLYYEQKFPPPTGRTDPNQIFPDSSQGFIGSLLPDSYQYLLLTDTATATLHSDADLGTAWRGSDWLLLRWLGDHMSSGFYRALERTTNTGAVNISVAANQSFQSLFGDFSLSLYTDSLPGIARSAVPQNDRFISRNLRRMYQRLFDTSSPQFAPRPFPIVTRSLTGTINATMPVGTMSFYRVNTASNAATVTITFSAPGGATLGTHNHPQLSVFRLPPGV